MLSQQNREDNIYHTDTQSHTYTRKHSHWDAHNFYTNNCVRARTKYTNRAKFWRQSCCQNVIILFATQQFIFVVSILFWKGFEKVFCTALSTLRNCIVMVEFKHNANLLKTNWKNNTDIVSARMLSKPCENDLTQTFYLRADGWKITMWKHFHNIFDLCVPIGNTSTDVNGSITATSLHPISHC